MHTSSLQAQKHLFLSHKSLLLLYYNTDQLLKAYTTEVNLIVYMYNMRHLYIWLYKFNKKKPTMRVILCVSIKDGTRITQNQISMPPTTPTLPCYITQAFKLLSPYNVFFLFLWGDIC